MEYEILISSKAEKQLKKLPQQYLTLIDAAISALALEPRPSGCKKLTGYDDYYRIRLGDYRIIYGVFDKVLKIEIIKVAHRKDVYK